MNWSGKTQCLDPELYVSSIVRRVARLDVLEAMPASEKLFLRARAARNWKRASIVGLSIIVADTGVGIPAALKENLFEPFFSTKELNPASDLGPQQIVCNHSGHVTVRSRTGTGHHWTI